MGNIPWKSLDKVMKAIEIDNMECKCQQNDWLDFVEEFNKFSIPDNSYQIQEE